MRVLRNMVALVGGMFASLMLGLQSAHAALPSGVDTAFAEMTTDFQTIFGYGFTALVAITTAMIAWRYTRKLGNKV